MSFFWRPPSELQVAPAHILGPQVRGARRPPRLSADKAPQCKIPKRSAAAAGVAPPPLVQYDTCDGLVNRVGHCRMQLPDGSIVVRPPSPHRYSAELVDDQHELLVVELRSPVASEHEAWLNDESVDGVLVPGQPQLTIAPRAQLRTYIMQRVPLMRCIRSLARATYKMCAPTGDRGPVLTLVPVCDLLALCESRTPTPPHDVL